MMKRIERIELMEQKLDSVLSVLQNMEEALNQYETAQEDVRLLADYLESREWKADFAADEAGRLPKTLKRGVLSEDGIWNVLERNRELVERMKAKDSLNE